MSRLSPPARPGSPPLDEVPGELVDLMERVRAMPPPFRADLEPMVAEAWEQARFRGRVLGVARDAIEQLRLDLEMTRFDLDATRREREELRERLNDAGEGPRDNKRWPRS